MGASLIAHDFMVALKTLPENEHTVVAVSSRSLDRATEFAERHKIAKAYGSYEELAKDEDVEVVYVTTIHPQHASLCKLALSHGKHVLCEKPFTLNLKDTKELFDLAKIKGLFIMEVSHRWVWVGWPEKGGGERFFSSDAHRKFCNDNILRVKLFPAESMSQFRC